MLLSIMFAEGVKYNSAKDVFRIPRRELYYNPLCSVETWLGWGIISPSSGNVGMLLSVLLEHFIFNSVKET